jgi:hypothetical protein
MTDNEQCAEKIGKGVNHCAELFEGKYQNGQGIEQMRSSVPTSTQAVRVQTVNPFKSLK